MARSKNAIKQVLNGITLQGSFAKEDPEKSDHMAAKVAYYRTKKFRFSINDALADWFESEAEVIHPQNPLSS